MPGDSPTLHVKGEVICPTSGFTARLVPHSPQGINPEIYLLDLVVNPPEPGTVVLQVETNVPVHFQEVTDQKYSDVTILPEGITVPVELVF